MKRILLKPFVVFIAVVLTPLLIEAFFRLNAALHFLPELYREATPLTHLSDADRALLSKLEGYSFDDIPEKTYSTLNDYHIEVDGPGDYSNLFPSGNSIYSHETGLACGAKTRAVLKGITTGRTIYDVEYSTDSDCHRKTVGNPKKADFDVVTMGCSWVFGDGIGDESTIASHLQKLLPRARVLNVGRSGGSPSVTLNFVEMPGNPQFRGLRRNSRFIYFFIDDQLRRVVGTVSWMRGKPEQEMYSYTVEEGGRLQRHKTLRDRYGKLTDLMMALGESKTIEYFRIEIPPLNQEKVDLAAKILVELKHRLLEKAPESQFEVVILPKQTVWGPSLGSALEKEGIKVLDLSGINVEALTNYNHVNAAAHPSGVVNKLIAALVYQRLFK